MAARSPGLEKIESEIRAIPGVIGAVVFEDTGGHPVEVQAFTFAGTAESEVRKQVASVLGDHGTIQSTERVFVFELAGEPVARPGIPNIKGAGPSLKRSGPSEPKALRSDRGRPRIGKIALAGTGPNAQVNVSLIFNGMQAQGLGRARKTANALRVTAAATLEAAQALVGKPGLLALEGVSLIEVMKRKVMVVLAHSSLGGGRLVLGASLVGDGPVHAATVRAALDAVNRQLDLAIQPTA